MKKFLFLLSAVILCFASCSKNNTSQKLSELIVGEWRYESQSLNGTLEEFEDDCRGKDGLDYLVFRNDMSFQLMDFDLNGGTDCTIEENTPANGSWSISEATLTISTDLNEAFDAEILVLNLTTLQYNIKVDFDGDTVQDDLVLIFKKQ
ncbi:lipocalin family protein [Maribacter sp.]|nr:lipocalin family protein [Maribacter sp.]